MKNWPAYTVERRPIEALVPHRNNARTHSPEQVEQIAASIREWGWTMPVLIDEENLIIAGHGRAMAAKLIGAEEVPVIVAAGWSEAQKRAYALADNKLPENAGWDRDLLKVEVSGLGELGFDLSLAGFSGDEVAAALAWGKVGQTDPDEVPPEPAVPAAETGDVWLLGPHRLVCGDCTDEGVVRACLGQETPHLMVTDPPYGVEYDPNWRNEAARTSVGMGNRAIGAGAVGKVRNDDRADWREAWSLFSGSVAYVWHGGLHSVTAGQSLAAARFRLRAHIVWVKTRHVIGRGNYHWQHEEAIYAARDDGGEDHWQDRFEPEHEIASYVARVGETAQWVGGRRQSTVWQIENVKNDTGHGTQKPVECMRRPILNNSKPGDAVYDPFVGSGTTIIAAEMTGRRCFAIEIDPVYVDVAVKRWENFSGQHAVCEKARARAA